jgi:hypothetical protein
MIIYLNVAVHVKVLAGIAQATVFNQGGTSKDGLKLVKNFDW